MKHSFGDAVIGAVGAWQRLCSDSNVEDVKSGALPDRRLTPRLETSRLQVDMVCPNGARLSVNQQRTETELSMAMNAMLVKILFATTAVVLTQAQAAPTRPVNSPFVEIVRTEGWPDRPGQGASGVVREVWVTDYYPNEAGTRVPLLRLRDMGEDFRADFFVWWPKRNSPPLPVSGPGIGCGAGTGQGVVCVQSMAVPLQRDWNELGTRLFGLVECRPMHTDAVDRADGVVGSTTSGVVDLGDLFVEAFDRGRYWTYFCNAPTSGSAVAKDAIDVYRFLSDLGRAVRTRRQ